MINTQFKSFFEKLFRPIGNILISFKITPNQITVAGLLFGILSCLIFLATRSLLLFFVLIVFSALFDAFDGVVARMANQSSKFGAYLDAMCDRLFEGVAALTVAIYSGYWSLIFLAMIGGMTVSYAKARAAIEVPVSNTEWPDLMERMERNVVFILGFFISEFFHIRIAGHDLFFWVLIGLNIAIYFTVIQRVLRAKRLIESRSKV